MSVPLALYRCATLLLTPFAPLILQVRALRGKEDPARLSERLGRAALGRPPGPVVWLHGASIGESLSLLPLVDGLRGKGFTALVTTGTQTGMKMLAARLPAAALHQLAPLDLPGAVAAFLCQWRPQLLIHAESELWPNTLCACHARGVPVALVNARMSARSFERWRRVPATARILMRTVALCAAQSARDEDRFAALGAPAVIDTGNLKYDSRPPHADAVTLAALRASVSTRPVVVAASTHPGEEAIVLRAHANMRQRHPDILTIIVPRDPSRSPDVASVAATEGLLVAVRSKGHVVSPDISILIADTVGEMGLWLRLASVAIIGKTFAGGGGQTPIEAALCSVPILHGPSTENFADAFAALDRAGGALAVGADTLGDALGRVLHNPAVQRAMARAAKSAVDALCGATARTLAALEPLLAGAAAAAPPP